MISTTVQNNLKKYGLNIKSAFLIDYMLKCGDINEASSRLPLIFTTEDMVNKEIDLLKKVGVIDEGGVINYDIVNSIYYSDTVKIKVKKVREKPTSKESIDVINHFNLVFGKNIKTATLSTKKLIDTLGDEECIRAIDYCSRCNWVQAKTSEHWFSLPWILGKASDFSDTGKYKIKDNWAMEPEYKDSFSF